MRERQESEERQRTELDALRDLSAVAKSLSTTLTQLQADARGGVGGQLAAQRIQSPAAAGAGAGDGGDTGAKQKAAAQAMFHKVTGLMQQSKYEEAFSEVSDARGGRAMGDWVKRREERVFDEQKRRAWVGQEG